MLPSPRRFAEEVHKHMLPVFREKSADLAARTGLESVDHLIISIDEMAEVLAQPICAHGLPRVMDCSVCRVDYTWIAQLQKFSVALGYGPISDEQAEIMIEEIRRR